RVVGFMARVHSARTVGIELRSYDEVRQAGVLCPCRRGLCKSCPNVSLRSRVLHRIDVAVVKLFECGIAVPGLCREVINTLAGVVQSHHVEVETASKHFVVRIYEDVLSGTRVVNLKVRSIVQLEVERTVVDDIACIGSSL